MINFKSIKYKNFLSTGDVFNIVEFDGQSTTLIIGDNGAGKSTVIDALTFALFGQAFRNIKKPSLVNEINKKKCVVELEFSNAGNSYRVVRAIKPNRFEIYRDGELVEQDGNALDYQNKFEKEILGMNFKTFAQIVVLGSCNYVPFLQIDPSQRRVVVEKLLDIEMFSVMNNLAKVKRKELSTEQQEVTTNWTAKNNTLKTLEEQNQKILQAQTKQVDEIDAKISVEREKLIGIERQIRFIEEQISDADKPKIVSKIDSTTKTLGQFTDVRKECLHKRALARKTIEFFETHQSCETCQQEIATEVSRNVIQEQSEKIEKINKTVDELDSKIIQLEGQLELLSEQKQQIKILETNLFGLNFEKSKVNDMIVSLVQQRESIVKQPPVADTTKLRQDIEMYKKRGKELDKQREINDICLKLLQDDGIKAQIIRKYIGVMNQTVNQYLRQMKLNVLFHMDETFTETIKTGSNEKSYNNLSEGEKARIDLAILLTWKQIAQVKNSCSSNLLVLDEVFDGSLDSEGVEDFFEIMGLLKQTNQVIVISHSNRDNVERFDECFLVKKQGNFSVIERV